MFLRMLRGPYLYEAFEPTQDRRWLTKISFPEFDIIAYYEIALYKRSYARWFIPNAAHHVAHIFTEVRGNVPEVFKKALARHFSFPVKGYDGNLTENGFYDMCMTFNDILSARMRTHIKT